MIIILYIIQNAVLIYMDILKRARMKMRMMMSIIIITILRKRYP